MKFKAFLLAAILTITLVPGVQGANFPIVSGNIQDLNGSPVVNVQVTANSGGLITDTCTDSKGNYKLQVKANSTVYIDVNGTTEHLTGVGGMRTFFGCEKDSAITNVYRGQASFEVQTSDTTFNIITPKRFSININVKDDNRNAIAGAIIALKVPVRYTSDGVAGILDSTWYMRNFENGVPEFITNDLGKASIPLFEFANNDEVSDECTYIYRSFGCIPIADSPIERVIFDDNNSDGHPDQLQVSYTPRPGVWQSEWVNVSDWKDGSADVIVLSVPSLTTSSPTTATFGSAVTVSTTAKLPSSTLSEVSELASSTFKNKKATLFARTFNNPLKPGKWLKMGTCKFEANGKCSIKVKIKKTLQVQFRPNGFSATVQKKTIKLK